MASDWPLGFTGQSGKPEAEGKGEKSSTGAFPGSRIHKPQSGSHLPRRDSGTAAPGAWDSGVISSFHIKMDGNAKHRHCLLRQQRILNMISSFQESRLSSRPKTPVGSLRAASIVHNVNRVGRKPPRPDT